MFWNEYIDLREINIKGGDITILMWISLREENGFTELGHLKLNKPIEVHYKPILRG